MTLDNVPPEVLNGIFRHSVSEWLETTTALKGPRGSWSAKSRTAFKELHNYWNINAYYRDIIYDLIQRAIGRLDEAAFVSLMGRAIEEPLDDHLLVVQLAYSPEKPARFQDPRAGSSFKTLLLCLAAAKGRCEVIKYLLSKGASLGDTATLDCIKHWRTRMSPLHYSIKCGHQDTTRLLLKYGAHIDSQAHVDKDTPLVVARQLPSGEIPDMVRLLLEEGANTNLENPLLSFATDGSDGTIELLLSHGAKIDQVSDTLYGMVTPLMGAVYHFNVDATRKLLEKGADVNKYNPRWGKTPLCTAVSCGVMREKDEKSNHDIIKLLLEHGADINKGTATQSPLALAAASANVPAVEILLKRDAEWRDTNSNGPISLQGLIDSHRTLMGKPQGLLLLKFIARCQHPLDRVRPAMLKLSMIFSNVLDDLMDLHDLSPIRFAKWKIRESSQVGGIGRFFTTNDRPESIFLQAEESGFWDIALDNHGGSDSD